MKLNLLKTILLLPALLNLISCNSIINKKPVKITSEPVYITGEILNHKPDKNTLTIYCNEILSGDQNTCVSLVDSSGNFQIKFNQYYPQDALIRYGDDAFPIIVHPKDSILIDEKGNIVKKGYQLRPSVGLIKTEIENLLKQ
jgi:hypothetical protein